MSERTYLWMTFPSKDEALTVARYISGNPEVEELPADGWLENPETGERYYYNICAMGPMRWPLPEGADPETTEPDIIAFQNSDGTLVEAYCVIGIWHGASDTVPFPLQAFMVETLPVRFG